MMSLSVVSWWSGLCAVAALNVLAWCFAAFAVGRLQSSSPKREAGVRRLQLALSAGYVFGCAFRSVFLVFDVPRICLTDSWLSSVILGRSVATVAELCFVAQWALMLRETSRASGGIVGRFASLTLVPLIVVAETCSWYSVLTTSNLGHVAEESIWAFSAALLVASLIEAWPRCTAIWRRILVAGCVAGAAYVAFMVLIDVPMYWSRFVADQLSARHYLSIAEGLHDAAVRRVVSSRWEDWKNEVPWMSLYFSVCVWISIALTRVTMLQVSRPAAARKRLKPVIALTRPTILGSAD
jgi:hypothetical protein